MITTILSLHLTDFVCKPEEGGFVIGPDKLFDLRPQKRNFHEKSATGKHLQIVSVPAPTPGRTSGGQKREMEGIKWG